MVFDQIETAADPCAANIGKRVIQCRMFVAGKIIAIIRIYRPVNINRASIVDLVNPGDLDIREYAEIEIYRLSAELGIIIESPVAVVAGTNVPRGRIMIKSIVETRWPVALWGL